MVDGSDSGRIAPLCAGVSAAAGVPRPRRSGVAIPAQRRWPGPGQEAPPRAPLCCATVFVGLPSAGLKEGCPHWPVAGAAARWHRPSLESLEHCFVSARVLSAQFLTQDPTNVATSIIVRNPTT